MGTVEPRVVALEVERMIYGPEAVGRLGGEVVFVPYAAPGDLLEVRLTGRRQGTLRAEIVSVVRPGADRREPPCSYYSRCGGCQWQHLSYEAQLAAKADLLAQQLARLGGVRSAEMLPPIPAPADLGYRHRLVLRVDGQRPGFYRARTHELVEIEACLLAAAPLAGALSTARDWLARLATVVRRIELAAGTGKAGIVLAGTAEGPFRSGDEPATEAFLAATPGVAGVILRGRRWRHVWGEVDVSLPLLGGLALTAPADQFTQVSVAGNEELIGAVLRLGGFGRGERVLDLYCGAGNLSLPIAATGAEVVGVDNAALAVAAAAESARRHGLEHCRFRTAAARVALEEIASGAGGEPPDAVVVDPPRAGAAEIVPLLARLRPPRIVYVSCNPATLARDLGALEAAGYRTARVQLVDLFPQTYHVEAVAECRLT